MLSRVEIANFRGFRSYKMQDLAQVNLVVGKNNSEGIQFLTSGGDPAVIAEAAQRRGEVIIGRPERSAAVDIAHFFHGHVLSFEDAITFKGDNGYAPVVMKVFAHKQEQGESKSKDGGVQGVFLKISGLNRSDREDPRFPISRDGGIEFDVSSFRFRRAGAVRRTAMPPVRFVGPDSLSSIDLAVMWDEITLTGQEVDIAGAMRVLDDQLDSVHFLTGVFSGGYFPARGGIVVGMKGMQGRIPIGSLGDGMRRLMALATSLAFTKGGCLFIDEIDTGLHYSVMPDMWKLIVSKAVAGNVQVFATTHSWDCIEGLKSLLCRDPEMLRNVAIHKIDRYLQHSVAFAGKSLETLVKTDIDPR